MKLTDIKVGSRLLAGFSIPLVLFIGFGIWLMLAMATVSEYVQRVRDESVPFAMTATAMEKDVIQVQQFLTDISATRGQDGLDDGFTEAAKHYNSFHRSLDKFQQMFNEEGNQQGLENIRVLRGDFDTFYRNGVLMAKAYINGGATEGNKLMGTFDKDSRALQQVLMPFVKSQVDEMAASIDVSDNETINVRRIALFTLLLVVVFTFLMTRIITLSITRPLTLMNAAIMDVAANSDFTRLAVVDGSDELAQTADAFNRLIDVLGTIIRQIRFSVEEIAKISQELAVSTEQTKMVTRQQSDISSVVAAATEELSVTVSEISQHTGESERLSEQGRSETSQALDITHQGISGMGETALAIQASVANVAKLSESSGQISGIVIVIKEIADQTNLLALNAAIEAARAGEMGRGFAVVADEVRNLAERTAGATNEIGRLISDIQSEIALVVDAMHAANEQAAHSVESAKMSEGALEKIGDNGEQINARVKEIAHSIKESEIAIHDIAIQMERISHMTEETGVAASHIDATADRLDEMAEGLRKSVAVFKIS